MVTVQQALRFLDQSHRNRFAAVEQKILPHYTWAGPHMQLVREPEQGIVFLGIVQVEDVLVVDADFADDGAGGLEFLE